MKIALVKTIVTMLVLLGILTILTIYNCLEYVIISFLIFLAIIFIGTILGSIGLFIFSCYYPSIRKETNNYNQYWE